MEEVPQQPEAVRRAQCEAFAMGQSERLGAGSQVRWLEPEVMRMILEQVEEVYSLDGRRLQHLKVPAITWSSANDSF